MATTTNELKVQTYQHFKSLQGYFVTILTYELEQCRNRILQAGGAIPAAGDGSDRGEDAISLRQRIEWVPLN